MLRQIDRRAAGIEGDLGRMVWSSRIKWTKLLDAAGECIEDLKGLHG